MPRLGELLVEAGVISEEHLEFALNVQRQRGGRLGRHLVELGFVSESALTKTLSKQLKLPAVSAAAIERVPREVIALLPVDSAVHHRALPVRREGNQLWVAMADPTDGRAIAELDAATRLTVRPMVASDLLISYALEKHYGVAAHTRPADLNVSPHLDLRLEPQGGSPLLTQLLGAVTPPVAAPVAAVPFPDPYTPSERAAINALVQDLDERAPVARLGLASLGARLVGASSERAVFDVATAFLEQDFERTVGVVIRGGRLVGLCAQGFNVSIQALEKFSAGLQEIPVLAKVIRDGRPRLGRASGQTLGGLTRVVGAPGERAVLLMPVRCAGEPIGALVAVGGRHGVESYVDEYVAVTTKVDLALQMVVIRKRILDGQL